MKIETLAIKGVLLIEPKRIYIAGGFYCDSYCSEHLANSGVHSVFVQERTSLKIGSGTVTGLHYQHPPFTQANLIRAVRGAIFAVAVDLRNNSPTYGSAVGVELTAENNFQLYVPEGLAIGYATLRPLTEIQCKSTKPLSIVDQSGVYWDDPALRIKWPVTSDEAIISARDSAWPLLSDIVSPFTIEAEQEGAAA